MLNKEKDVNKLPHELEFIFKTNWQEVSLSQIPVYTTLFKESLKRNNIDVNSLINFEEVMNISGMGVIYINQKNKNLFSLKTTIFEACILYANRLFDTNDVVWDQQSGFAFLFIKSLCDNLHIDTNLPEKYMGEDSQEDINWFKYTISESKFFDALLALDLKIETVEGKPNFLTNISIMSTENLLKIIAKNEINPFIKIDKNDPMNAFAYLAMVLKSDLHSSKEKERTLRNLRVLSSFLNEDHLDKEILKRSPYPKLKNLTYRQLYNEFAHDLLIPYEKKEIDANLNKQESAKIKTSRL